MRGPAMIDWRILGRLPARFWLQLVIGLAVLAVLAVFGFALLLGGAVIILGIALVAQLMAWFRGRPPPRPNSGVIDGEYQVVEQQKPPPPPPRNPDI